MPAIRFVAKDSKRIGRQCCPICESLNLLQRANHWYCRKNGCTFKTPAKVKATPLKQSRRASIKRAGPCLYRGFRWLDIHAMIF